MADEQETDAALIFAGVVSTAVRQELERIAPGAKRRIEKRVKKDFRRLERQAAPESSALIGIRRARLFWDRIDG